MQHMICRIRSSTFLIRFTSNSITDLLAVWSGCFGLWEKAHGWHNDGNETAAIRITSSPSEGSSLERAGCCYERQDVFFDD
eukprot:11891084-Karenia_brevis.AAC.1